MYVFVVTGVVVIIISLHCFSVFLIIFLSFFLSTSGLFSLSLSLFNYLSRWDEPESSINFEFSRSFSHRNVGQCARKWDWGHLNSWFSLSFSREGLGSSLPFQFKGRAHCVFTLTFTLSFLPLHDFRWVMLRCDLNFYLFLCVLIVSLFNPQHLHRCFQGGEESESCMTDHSLLHFWCPTFLIRIAWFKTQESFLQCICKEQMTEGKKGRVREGVSWKWCSSFTERNQVEIIFLSFLLSLRPILHFPFPILYKV